MKQILIILFILISNFVLGQTFTYSGYIYNANEIGANNVKVNLLTKLTVPYLITTPTYSPPLAYNSGTVVSSSDDVITGLYNIGFTFNFFGLNYTQFYICSNGWIGFSAGQTNGYTAMYLPNTSSPKNVIMADWEDLYPTSSNIYYQTIGSAPNRKLVVSFYNCPHYSCGTSLYTFQFVLYETSNIIDINVLSKPLCSGYSATQGLVNSTNTVVVPVGGRNASEWSISTGETKRFTPSTPETTFSLHSTYYTNSSGYYNINPALDINNYVFQIQIPEPIPVTTIQNKDSYFVDSLVLGLKSIKSVDYYRMDVNNDNRFTISDVFYIFMKKNGLLSWVTPSTYIFTPTQFTTIKTSTINLKPTYPGLQNITISSPTNGGNSNFYIVKTGYSNLTNITY
jgi:hypothetical protein